MGSATFRGVKGKQESVHASTVALVVGHDDETPEGNVEFLSIESFRFVIRHPRILVPRAIRLGPENFEDLFFFFYQVSFPDYHTITMPVWPSSVYLLLQAGTSGMAQLGILRLFRVMLRLTKPKKLTRI